MAKADEKEAPGTFVVKNWNASAASQERGIIRGRESSRAMRVTVTLKGKPPWESDDDA